MHLYLCSAQPPRNRIHVARRGELNNRFYRTPAAPPRQAHLWKVLKCASRSSLMGFFPDHVLAMVVAFYTPFRW